MISPGLQLSSALLGPHLGLPCSRASALVQRALSSWATVDPAQWDGKHPAVAQNLGEDTVVPQQPLQYYVADATCATVTVVLCWLLRFAQPLLLVALQLLGAGPPAPTVRPFQTL
jgi:hypothetical protein